MRTRTTLKKLLPFGFMPATFGWIELPTEQLSQFHYPKSKIQNGMTIILLVTAILTFVFSPPALAADTANGAKIFSANCAACHMGGRNVVAAPKTLKKDALEKYNMNSLEAIVHQVQNGKNAMPAFKGRLNDKQIEDVATYVLEQSDKGWVK
jgi:cytochrome c6